MKNQIYKIVDNFFEDNIPTHAAALSYYTALGAAPIAILVVVVLGVLGFDLQESFLREISTTIGPDAGNLFRTVISAANERPDLRSISGIIAGVGLLISASLIFMQLQETMNLVFDAKPKNVNEMSKREIVRDFFMTRILSIGILAAFIFILIVSLVISTGLELVYANQGGVYRALNACLSFAVFTLLFGLIFKWMPDRKINFSSALKGGFLTAALFMVGKTLIGIYLANSAVGSAYGAAGSILVTLVWVYYSAIVVFIGAEASYVSIVEGSGTKYKTVGFSHA